MYTSGSTGAAKGVIITHYNIVSSVAGLGAGIGIIRDTDTYIGYLPLAHILEVTAELTCLVIFMSLFEFCFINHILKRLNNQLKLLFKWSCYMAGMKQFWIVFSGSLFLVFQEMVFFGGVDGFPCNIYALI